MVMGGPDRLAVAAVPVGVGDLVAIRLAQLDDTAHDHQAQRDGRALDAYIQRLAIQCSGTQLRLG
jgi:hypothetical protein